MPECGHCRDCKHWKQARPDDWGYLEGFESGACQLITRDETEMAGVYAHDIHPGYDFVTDADFGCVLWEVKGDA